MRRRALIVLAVVLVVAGPIVADQRLVLRAEVALIVIIGVMVVLRFASTGSQPDLPDTWRPYG